MRLNLQFTITTGVSGGSMGAGSLPWLMAELGRAIRHDARIELEGARCV